MPGAWYAPDRLEVSGQAGKDPGYSGETLDVFDTLCKSLDELSIDLLAIPSHDCSVCRRLFSAFGWLRQTVEIRAIHSHFDEP